MAAKKPPKARAPRRRSVVPPMPKEKAKMPELVGLPKPSRLVVGQVWGDNCSHLGPTRYTIISINRNWVYCTKKTSTERLVGVSRSKAIFKKTYLYLGRGRRPNECF